MSRRLGKNKRRTSTPIKASPSTSSSVISTGIKGLKLEESPSDPKRDIVAQFDQYWGNGDGLANWQKLCRDVGIKEDLNSKTKCRKALGDVWVNIYDLIDAHANDTLPQRFPSERALAKYTLKHHKIYPKREAKSRGAVRALLAHIFGGR